MQTALQEFGVASGDRAFRYALKAVGIRPVEVARAQGRSHLYDPISAWAIASVYFARKGRLAGLDNALETYRELARNAWTLSNAEVIPGFVGDLEYAAQLLLIFGPDYGMPPTELIELLRRKPELLEYCRYGRDYLYGAIDSYKSVYAQWLSSEPLIREYWDGYVSEEELRRRFAEWWTQRFGNLFRQEELGRRIRAGELKNPNEE